MGARAQAPHAHMPHAAPAQPPPQRQEQPYTLRLGGGAHVAAPHAAPGHPTYHQQAAQHPEPQRHGYFFQHETALQATPAHGHAALPAASLRHFATAAPPTLQLQPDTAAGGGYRAVAGAGLCSAAAGGLMHPSALEHGMELGTLGFARAPPAAILVYESPAAGGKRRRDDH